VQICDYKVVVNQNYVVDYIIGLRQDCAPIAADRMVNIDSYDSSARGIQVGMEIENRVNIANKVVESIGIVKQSDEMVGAFHRSVTNAILGVGAVIDLHDEKFAVLGNKWIKTQFFVIGAFVDEPVLRLGCAELVPVNTIVVGLVFGRDGVWVGEAIVEKAGAVVLPGDTREPAPFKSLGGILLGINVADFDFLLVASASGKGISKQIAVFADGGGGYGDSAVGTEEVGVDDDTRFAFERFLRVEDRLVLQAVIFPEEVAVAFLVWSGIPGVIQQMGQAGLDFLSGGNTGEEVGGQLVLLRYPRQRFGCVGIFEPTVGVGNFDAVINVGGGILSRRRINQFGGPGFGWEWSLASTA